MSSPSVSIIIPVYNVAPYLDECIRSVAGQSWTDFELILVDDGSTDGSLDIAEAWQKRDSRIRVASIDHGGPGKARNTGVDYSQSKYITFIDSDDTVGDDYLKCLMEGMASGDCDFSMMEVSWQPRQAAARVLSREKAMEEFLYQKSSFASVCGKMFKRELLEEERFSEEILYEDLDLMARILLNADKIGIVDRNLYFYRKHDASILGHFTERRLDVLKVTSRIVDMVEREMPQLIKGAYDRHMSASFNMLILLAREGETDRAEYDECWSNIRRFRRCSLWNPKVRRKNKAGALLSYLGRNLFIKIATKL